MNSERAGDYSHCQPGLLSRARNRGPISLTKVASCLEDAVFVILPITPVGPSAYGR